VILWTWFRFWNLRNRARYSGNRCSGLKVQ